MSNFLARIALVGVALAVAGSPDRATAQASKFHPNREKYSDAGAKPASGRSGSASLESRALLGKDGAVVVEATSGSFEGGTAPGQIRKMQVKLFSPAGNTAFVENFNGLSGNGYWSNSYPGVGRNQKFQLQANVGGIDANRNDVVTVTTEVKRRPDLAVDAVTAPAKALAGARVNIVGTVSEKNGDVGARATCMLTIDGNSVVDQADGIWVDAGHTVSCAFQTTFATLGTRQVRVYVSGISPSDWDASNNSAGTTIEVLSPETPMNYAAQFNSSDLDYQTHTKFSSSDADYVDEKTETGTRKTRAMSLSSWTSTDAFTFPVKVHSSLSSGGSAVFDVTNDVAYQASASWSGGDCGNLFQDGFVITVCNYHYGNVNRSQVDVSSYDGRVTYFGTRYYKSYGFDGYATNYSADNPMGYSSYPVGSDVRPVVELTDARGTMFVSRPAISLTAAPVLTQYSSCSLNRRTAVTFCSDGKTTGTTKSGSASDNSR